MTADIGTKITMRYYFNLISSSGVIKDLEGIDISSIEDARLEAMEAARQIMSGAILEGRDVSGMHSKSAMRQGKTS